MDYLTRNKLLHLYFLLQITNYILGWLKRWAFTLTEWVIQIAARAAKTRKRPKMVINLLLPNAMVSHRSLPILCSQCIFFSVSRVCFREIRGGGADNLFVCPDRKVKLAAGIPLSMKGRRLNAKVLEQPDLSIGILITLTLTLTPNRAYHIVKSLD